MVDNMYWCSYKKRGRFVTLSSILILPKRTQPNRIYAKKKLQKFLGAHCVKPEIE